MTYLVTVEEYVRGSLRTKPRVMRRCKDVTAAIDFARGLTGGGYIPVATVTSSTRHGRGLVGTVRNGDFKPASAYERYLSNEEIETMATKTTKKRESGTDARRRMREENAKKTRAPKKQIPKKPEQSAPPVDPFRTDKPLIAYAWLSSESRVGHTKVLGTEAGIMRWAERQLEDAKIKEVAITQEGSRRRVLVDRNRVSITTLDKPFKVGGTKAARKATDKPARRNATPTVAGKSIKAWNDVLPLTDRQIQLAHKDGRTPLTFNEEGIRRAAKTTDATQRYDMAYLRFLAGLAGSVPSNPTSTGLPSGEDRANRRAAIRKAIEKVECT